MLRPRFPAPVRAALVVGGVYLACAVLAIAGGRAPSFAFVGERFLSRPGTSGAIREHVQATSRSGYDGQFALFIAVDPVHAAPTLDAPAYRYSHIVYPLLARAAALGRNGWIPAALLLVNALAVLGGTLALALVLRRGGRSPWLGGLFGLFPGAAATFARDLNDLLAYSFVAAGLLALRWERPRRVALAGLALALAALTRETTLVFPIVLALFHGRRAGQRRAAAALALAAAAPYAAWRLFLFAWLGSAGAPDAVLARYPFAGIVGQRPWDGSAILDVISIVVPGVILLAAALVALRRTPSPMLAVLVAELVWFVVFLPAQSYADYYAAGRLQLGVVLAALCCAPALRSVVAPVRPALPAAALLAATPALLVATAVPRPAEEHPRLVQVAWLVRR